MIAKIIRKLLLNIFAELRPIMMSEKFRGFAIFILNFQRCPNKRYPAIQSAAPPPPTVTCTSQTFN